MTPRERLLSIIRSAVHEYMAGQPDLQPGTNAQPFVLEHGVFGEDDFHQIEIEVVHDDAECGNRRIMGLIDDGRQLQGSYSIIIDEHGNVISEGGRITRRWRLF